MSRLRLKNFDYTQPGIFFITIVTFKRRQLFGTISEGKMYLSEIGKLVEEEWYKSEEIRPEVYLDEFCVMPDHFHGIVGIAYKGESLQFAAHQFAPENSSHKSSFGSPKKGLSKIVGLFKGAVTKQYRELISSPDAILWQRRFHDRIIRNEKEMERIRQYIISNPENWRK